MKIQWQWVHYSTFEPTSASKDGGSKKFNSIDEFFTNRGGIGNVEDYINRKLYRLFWRIVDED